MVPLRLEAHIIRCSQKGLPGMVSDSHYGGFALLLPHFVDSPCQASAGQAAHKGLSDLLLQ
eukprot:CAMPEP_0172826082 /NCGR_PEP_ID=MMETSP1075-20121228/19161_1 /TAXON_ID=2916 /ORGANISM="Ceratium fusus, Strain PA161109" /LENGTH=60 /DNA_ID=CAMNT_0013667649 /DNA_START=104 /DNA_END=286 /DNA_ORIENTATION=-